MSPIFWIKIAIKKIYRLVLITYFSDCLIGKILYTPIKLLKCCIPKKIKFRIDAYEEQIKIEDKKHNRLQRKISLLPFVYYCPRNKNNCDRKRAVVFASFFAEGIIPEYVIAYLEGFQDIADYVIFISDNGLQSEKEIDKISTLIDYAECAHHGGYDFNSYKKGIEHLKSKEILKSFDELILANDSCYGPVFPLKNIFEAMKTKSCDFWGLCDNYEYRRHLQSFFLVFNNSVVNSKLLFSFFSKLQCPLSYKEAVKNEIRFSSYLSKQFTFSEYIETLHDFQTGKEVDKAHNKTAWPLSLLKEGFPLIKVKALTGDYGMLLKENISETLEYVKSINPCIHNIIVNDLEYRHSIEDICFVPED